MKTLGPEILRGTWVRTPLVDILHVLFRNISRESFSVKKTSFTGDLCDAFNAIRIGIL